MAESQNLVRVIHKLVSDEEFRQRFMITPREVLMAELGISGEAYDSLVALAPILLIGGLVLLGGGEQPGSKVPLKDPWGRW